MRARLFSAFNFGESLSFEGDIKGVPLRSSKN